jgi:Tetratricopeptide repeat
LRFKECHGKLEAAPPASVRGIDAFDGAMQAFRQAQNESAVARFDAVLAADPDNELAAHFKGYALCRLGRFEEGVPLLERAVRAQPRNPDFHGNLGIIRYVLGELPEAIRSLQRAIELAPTVAEPYGNLSMALRDSGEFERALAAARHAVQLRPDLAAARLNLALALLALGNYDEAWRAYVWRPDPTVNLRDLGTPGVLAHASVLPGLERDPWITLHGEQGVGDVIFFLRFARALRDRGAKLRFWGDERVAPMLLRSAIVDAVSPGRAVPAGTNPSHLVWIGDLPALLGMTSEFPPSPRIEADDARVKAVRERLAACGPPPYTAITWRAGLPRRGKAVLEKAVAPAAFGAALKGIEGTVVSVQRNPDAGEARALAEALGKTLHDLSGLNADLEDMLAVMHVADEYVGVSNTNMHLRAAAGRTARLLLPWPPEWRWTRNLERSPWFPDFPLYRADSSGGWSDALRRLANDLDPP